MLYPLSYSCVFLCMRRSPITAGTSRVGLVAMAYRACLEGREVSPSHYGTPCRLPSEDGLPLRLDLRCGLVTTVAVRRSRYLTCFPQYVHDIPLRHAKNSANIRIIDRMCKYFNSQSPNISARALLAGHHPSYHAP